MEDYLDDRVIVPDYIKAMSDEELDMEIARLKKEAERKNCNFNVTKQQESSIESNQYNNSINQHAVR